MITKKEWIVKILSRIKGFVYKFAEQTALFKVSDDIAPDIAALRAEILMGLVQELAISN